MTTTNQLSAQNNQAQLQDYFSIHPFYSEYCKHKSIIAGLTPGDLADLTIDTRKFAMNHAGHLSPNMTFPGPFISQMHQVQCLSMEYLSYPSEDFLKKLSNANDSQDCSGSFLVGLRMVMHELSDFLHHINWIFQTKSETVPPKPKKVPPENVRNILNQLSLKDMQECSKILNVNHSGESSNRCQEEKQRLETNIKKANATMTALRKDLQDAKAKVTQLEKGWGNSNETVIGLRKDLQDAKAKVTQLEKGWGNSNETVIGLRKDLQDAKAKVTQLEKGWGNSNETVIGLRKDLQDANQTETRVRKELQDANTKVTQIQKKLEETNEIVTGLRKELEDGNAKVVRLEKDLNATVAELEQGRQNANETVSGLRKDLEDADQTRKDLEDAHQTVARLEQELQVANASVTTFQDQVAEKEAQSFTKVAELEQQLQDANQTETGLRKELQNANANVVRLETQLEDAYEIVIGLSKQLEDGNAKIVELEKDLNATVTELEQGCQDADETVSGLRKDLQDADQTRKDLEDAHQTVARLERELQVANASLSTFQGQVAEKEAGQREKIDLNSNDTDIRSRNVTQVTDQKEERKTILVAGIHFDPNQWGVYVGILSAFSIVFCTLGSILTAMLARKKSPLVNQGESEEESSDSEEGTELVELKSVKVQEENGQCDSVPLKPSFGYIGQRHKPIEASRTHRTRPIGLRA